MGYRVPDDAAVLSAIEEVLVRQGAVESQAKLTQLVKDELRREDAALTVGESRVRRLALEHDLAEVEVVTGTTGRPPPETCPVCQGELAKVKNRTLSGRETVVGTRCKRCSYRSGPTLEVPLRYAFRLKEADGHPQAPRAEAKGPF